MSISSTMIRSSAATPMFRQIRPFFASSTDHTRLLREAEVHVCKVDQGRQYVLAASGMDTATVQKVPQLHLARLFVGADDVMYGAKVVNRTLGQPKDVCGKLVDAAKRDNVDMARSTLHGLVDWVKSSSASSDLSMLTEEELNVVKQIAAGKREMNNELWAKVAKEFARTDTSLETALYMSNGASLVEILPDADTTDFKDTSKGAMALLKFA